MVRLVITHGRSQEFGIGTTLHRDWEDALRQGLDDADASFAAGIPIDFAFYGNLWRPDAGDFAPEEVERGGDGIDRGDDAEPTDLQLAVAQEMLAAIPAHERTETERFGWDTIADLVGDLDDKLGVGKLTIKLFLQDIDRYFAEADLRQKAIARLTDAIGDGDGPVVLLAHSLGTIIAYDALREHPELPVPGFVTFGSPLGLASVRGKLERDGALTYPPPVLRWANIYEERDVVAAGIELAPLYPSDNGRSVEDHVSKGKGPSLGNIVASHDAIVYLSSAALAMATRDIVESFLPQAAPAANGGSGDEDRAWEPAPDFAVEASPEEAERGPVDRQEASPASGSRRGIPHLGGEEERGGGDLAADGEAKRDVTRAAAATFPPLVKPGDLNDLTFEIGAPTMVSGDSVETFTASLPASMTTLTLTALVQAPEFEVVDAHGNLASQAVSVSLDLTNDSALVSGRFTLRARDSGRRVGTDVRLRILHDNNPVATITLPTIIAAGGATTAARPDRLAGNIVLRENEAPGAELTLYVNDRDGDERFEIGASFKGRARSRPFYYLDSFPVERGAWEYSREILEQFRSARKLPAEQRQARVDAIGVSLWNKLPQKFRDFYWSDVHGQVQTILICSDEPYIPWELVKPQRSAGGETAPMLGLTYQMGRWEDERDLPGAPLVVSNFVVIAPAYATNALPSADMEANDLVAEFQARREQPGSRQQVTQLFMENSPELLHFSGHGTFQETGANSQISLADAALDTIDVAVATFGQEANPPLVFLNACEVGATGWSLTKIGGWAEAFCEVGATGFVGPYWPVADGVARKAAMIFYRSLQAGDSVGQSMIRIRQRFTEDDEHRFHPSWLAYSLHCHPNLKVQLAGT